MNDVLDDNLQEGEVINSNVRWAGFWIRVGAALIDFLVYIPPAGLLIYNLFSLKSLPLQLAIIIALAIYKPLMEYKYGATLGKMAMGIKVVNHNFGGISLTQALTRYIPWAVGQVISIISNIILFANVDFLSASGMTETAEVQANIIPGGISYLGTTLILVSVIVVAFTDNKRGLHDMLADTYCIYK